MVKVNWKLSIFLSIILSVIATALINGGGWEWLQKIERPAFARRSSGDAISIGFIFDSGLWAGPLEQMVSNASQELVDRGARPLAFAGVVNGQQTARPGDLKEIARAGKLRADIVFFLSDDARFIHSTCGRSDAAGCAIKETASGYLLYPSRGIRFENLLIHELGHIFGLRHSDNPQSIMFETPGLSPLLTSEYVAAMERF